MNSEQASKIEDGELDIAPDKNNMTDIPHKKEKLKRHLMPYGKVLIVDDVKHNLLIAKGLLTPYKLQIETALSGYEAIGNVKRGETYDIIFMDHMMPGMDGVETVQHLRESGYTKPVVALTANEMVGQADIFIQTGFDDLITKPIDIHRLDMILNKLVRDTHEPGADDDAVSDINIQNTPEENNSPEITESIPLTDDAKIIDKLINHKIPGIDIVNGLERYYNKADVYLNVLHSYVSNVNFLLENLEYQMENDINNYIVSVHGIKGASYSVFADNLSETAEKLENAAENNDYELISRETPAFMKNAKSLMDKLMELIEKLENENPKPVKAVPDKDVLSRLCDACKLYDIRKAEEAMAEIDEFKYQQDNGLVDWLRERVNIMQYKQIIEKLSEG